MLGDNKHIDSLFADGLKNLSVPPNPKIWEGISNQMLATKKKRRLAIYIWTGVAASILLLLAIENHYLINQSDYNLQLNTLSENNRPAQNDVVKDKQFNSEKDNKERANTSANHSSEKIGSNSASHSVGKTQEQLAVANQSVSNHSEDEITTDSSVKTFVADPRIISSLDSDQRTDIAQNSERGFLDRDFVNIGMDHNKLESLGNYQAELPDRLQINTSQWQKEKSVSLLAEEMQIQRNLLAIEQLKQQEKKEDRWSVIGQVSSSYSSYSGEGNKTGTGIWSVGGGAKVNYAMNKKLALQTGLVYNRFGQDFSSRSRGELMYSDPMNVVPGDKLNGDVIEKVISYPSQTAAGPIKLSSSNQMDGSAEYTNSSYSSSDLIQRFESIEVPLLMRYNLIQKRMGMFVTGGISANMIVGNGVYDQSEGNKIGEIDGIRNTNLSSQFSFGFEYRLSSKLQFGVEPSVKYYLNSLNKSSRYDYKPYSIGIFTGIRYDF